MLLRQAVLVGSVRASDTLSTSAGDISGQPDPLPVPFSTETPPLAVLASDLERMLPSHAAAPAAAPDTTTTSLRLDVTLTQAHVRRTYHLWKSSTMHGSVIIDVSLVDGPSERTLWSQRIVGEHVLRPTYITSEAAEEALNAAYARALANLRRALVAATESDATP